MPREYVPTCHGENLDAEALDVMRKSAEFSRIQLRIEAGEKVRPSEVQKAVIELTGEAKQYSNKAISKWEIYADQVCMTSHLTGT